MPGPRKTVKNKGTRQGEKITDRQIALVDAYFENGFNKREAMRAVGYPETSVVSNCYQVFGHVRVQEEIEKRHAKLREKVELNEEWVVKRLMRLADSSLGVILLKLQQNDYDLSTLTDDERYALDGFEIDTVATEGGVRTKHKVKVADKIGPLIALCRKLGLFRDNVNVTGALTLVERLQRGRDNARAVED